MGRFQASGSKHHALHGFWNQRPQTLRTWGTLGFWIPEIVTAPAGPGQVSCRRPSGCARADSHQQQGAWLLQRGSLHAAQRPREKKQQRP